MSIISEMDHLFHAIWQQRSLRYKLLSVVLIVLVILGSALIGIIVVIAERERSHSAIRDAHAMGAAIDKTLRSAMLSGDRKVVRTAVETLAEQNEVVSITVLTEDGSKVIRAGTKPEWQKTIDTLTRKARETNTEITTQIGDTDHAVIIPVHSEASCTRCHGQSERLGFISAIVSTAHEEQRIRETRDRLVWGGLLLLG
jgi:hypothetical protein